MAEQMKALSDSGLLAEADEFHIGINGNESDLEVARLFVPCSEAHFTLHGSGATTELLTLGCLRRWLADHADWCVLYHHMKGVSHPQFDAGWRRTMEHFAVWKWKDCIRDLEAGHDAVGSYWLTPEQNPGSVKSPFFGGNFWWSKASYLLRLPPLPPAVWENRYEAETWIGRGVPRPNIVDYQPGWPPTMQP